MMGSSVIKRLRFENIYTFIGLIVLCIILSILSPVFLTWGNISNIFLQSCINGLLAIGVTFVIISGGIDLSVGAILALSGIITAICLRAEFSLIPAVIIGVLVGGIIGLISGLIITGFHMPPFIVTLGMMSMTRGLALVASNGQSIYGFDDAFQFIGQGYIIGIPMPVIILFVVAFIGFFILKYTRIGRYAYAIGGNIEATKLSGVNTKKYMTILYCFSGLSAGLAGIIMASRLDSAQGISGLGYELQAIAAAVIGGTSLSGGEGSVWGTIIGTLIISVIGNGMNLLNVSSFIQQIIIGFVIILAVFLDSVKKRNH
ncbi:MAG: ABC transporter permease [Christensenellales bacterium]|jgi:ribose transport system permease protein